MGKDYLTEKVIGCAIEVHRQLGPGLLESSYERCLLYELAEAEIDARAQVFLPVEYKGMILDAGYRIDILIPGQLVLELKSAEKLLPIHTAQMLTYLKLSGIKKGLLINFNESKLINGLKRVVL
ncbi:GxxExxY protein [Neptuniibacter sp.]|uniref:GxxExxY protein n=1 Tax=Neptuniibacter sp. TaxID=1962643 RepID=UPI002602B5E2|nr:GxxExxY protein [Neptuniibacter sp.]MCP4597486.1 GxxExxY protein [Neptuniibacter sp.]